jgi:hypothetical protein
MQFEMRKTINISVSEEMHAYILEQAGYGTVSEYIRSLVRSEQQLRADYAQRPTLPLARANDTMVFATALDQLERLRAILEQKDNYDA